MLGIVLIALAAVIGLGFGVFSIAKGVANQGVVDVQDNLGTVAESAFEDFDQKVVTGTQVVSAYRQFQGKPVAILIKTQAMEKGVDYNKEHKSEGITEIKLGTDSVKYVNYNALLEQADKDEVLKYEQGIFKHEGAFKLDGKGKVDFDAMIAGFSQAGNSEYIASSAKFEASLVKDASSTIIGVVFTQLKR